ncbi:MAG TPA: hypothetical protein PKM50_09670, partial [Methanoregula sp.]|nr:hypothetical protein [Methanoregula sp.]
MKQKTILILILLAALVVSGVIAADIGTKATVTVSATKATPTVTAAPTIAETVENLTIVKTGNTTISAGLSMKSTPVEKAILLSSITKSALAPVKFPYSIEDSNCTVVVEITKYRCTSEMCGYWVTATRGGKEVATNSPIWIYPPPYQ